MARVPTAQAEQALLKSGIDGLSVWEQRPKAGEDPRHRVVWLLAGTTLTGAFKAQETLPEQAGRGVVCKVGRVGVRVRSGHFVEAVR